MELSPLEVSAHQKKHKKRKPPVKKTVSGEAMDSDAPAAFRRAMHLRDKMQQQKLDQNKQKLAREESKDNKNTSGVGIGSDKKKMGENGQPEKATRPKGIRPGESLVDYAIRVDREANEAIVKAIQTGEEFGVKRKQRFQQAMQLKREKKDRERQERMLDQQWEREQMEKTRPRFGEVAQAPPVLDILPKQRHKQDPFRGKQKKDDTMPTEDMQEWTRGELALVQEEHEEQERQEQGKKKPKLSLFQKQQREVERRRAVQAYRIQKATQVQELQRRLLEKQSHS